MKKAYLEYDGNIDTIMQHIPHSTFEDEARFVIIISGLIKKGDLVSLKTWERSTKDDKAKLIRKKQGEKEAEEAEEQAKELGVWDEFYGSGKPSAKRSKGKGKSKAKDEEEDEEDTSALQALILKKRKNLDGFFDNLAAKYGEPTKGGKKKRKGKVDNDGDEEDVSASPQKRARKEPPSDPMDDDEFKKLQETLVANRKSSKKKGEPSATKATRGSKGRKAK